ncbi:MAG: hypothetical protein LUD03_01345 [Firmicutes bacterium]|nr:hypothetical protein [Bacillota bacterium]
MTKKIIIAAALAALILSGCGNKTKNQENEVKNQEYIDELTAAGADADEIEKLIEYEKTNDALPDGGYVDTTGKTVAEAAEENGMTLEEYIAENNLPENLPSLVSENEANYTIPVSKMAERYGMSFEEFKQTLDFPDSVTEDTTWGEALDEVTIGAYIGEGNVESFKEKYNLPDSVSADTKWGEVRETVDAAKRENRISSESDEETENAE